MSSSRRPDRLTDLLALSHVPRWSIVRRVREQSVSDHVFRTMVIAWELLDRLDERPSEAFWRYLLIHDAEEAWTGDPPRRAKRYMRPEPPTFFCPWLDPPALPSRELRVIKAADLIEALTWIDMHGLGNQAERVVAAMREDIASFASLDPMLLAVVDSVIADIMEDRGVPTA